MFIDIIEISEVIVSNDYQKLLPRTKEMRNAYNSSVKPMINNINLNQEWDKIEAEMLELIE